MRFKFFHRTTTLILAQWAHVQSSHRSNREAKPSIAKIKIEPLIQTLSQGDQKPEMTIFQSGREEPILSQESINILHTNLLSLFMMSLSRLRFVEFLIHHCSFSHNRTSDKGNNFKGKEEQQYGFPLRLPTTGNKTSRVPSAREQTRRPQALLLIQNYDLTTSRVKITLEEFQGPGLKPQHLQGAKQLKITVQKRAEKAASFYPHYSIPQTQLSGKMNPSSFEIPRGEKEDKMTPAVLPTLRDCLHPEEPQLLEPPGAQIAVSLQSWRYCMPSQLPPPCTTSQLTLFCSPRTRTTTHPWTWNPLHPTVPVPTCVSRPVLSYSISQNWCPYILLNLAFTEPVCPLDGCHYTPHPGGHPHAYPQI